MSLHLCTGNNLDSSRSVAVIPEFSRSGPGFERLESGDTRTKRTGNFRFPRTIVRYESDTNKNATNASSEENSEEDEASESGGDVFDLDYISRPLDQFFFIWHSSLMMACLLLVIVGVVLRFHFTSIVISAVQSNPYYKEYGMFVEFKSAPRELNFGNLTQSLGNALMILNAIHIVCIMMYMSFQLHKNHFTLPVVCFISGIVVIMEINTANVYMSTTSAPITKATHDLKNKINSSYAVDASNVISVTHDLLAIWGHCCGVQELYDFQDMSLNFPKERSPIAYPPACCNEAKYAEFSKDVNTTESSIKNCAMLGEGVYTEGCFMMLFNWLNMYCVLYSIVIIGQLFDIFIHLATYNKMVNMFEYVCDSY